MFSVVLNELKKTRSVSGFFLLASFLVIAILISASVEMKKTTSDWRERALEEREEYEKLYLEGEEGVKTSIEYIDEHLDKGIPYGREDFFSFVRTMQLFYSFFIALIVFRAFRILTIEWHNSTWMNYLTKGISFGKLHMCKLIAVLFLALCGIVIYSILAVVFSLALKIPFTSITDIIEMTDTGFAIVDVRKLICLNLVVATEKAVFLTVFMDLWCVLFSGNGKCLYVSYFILFFTSSFVSLISWKVLVDYTPMSLFMYSFQGDVKTYRVIIVNLIYIVGMLVASCVIAKRTFRRKCMA